MGWLFVALGVIQFVALVGCAMDVERVREDLRSPVPVATFEAPAEEERGPVVRVAGYCQIRRLGVSVEFDSGKALRAAERARAHVISGQQVTVKTASVVAAGCDAWAHRVTVIVVPFGMWPPREIERMDGFLISTNPFYAVEEWIVDGEKVDAVQGVFETFFGLRLSWVEEGQ